MSEKLSDEQIVAAAVPEFAKELKMTPPAVVRVEAGPGGARILDLHAAALVAMADIDGGLIGGASLDPDLFATIVAAAAAAGTG